MYFRLQIRIAYLLLCLAYYFFSALQLLSFPSVHKQSTFIAIFSLVLTVFCEYVIHTMDTRRKKGIKRNEEQATSVGADCIFLQFLLFY